MAKYKNCYAVVATGPSLTKGLVEYIKNKYENIICVSNSYEFFKENCKAIVSSDGEWWNYYKPDINCDKFSLGDIHKNKIFKDVVQPMNSGCFALIVCRKIYKPKFIHLYGFDMTNKKGDHYFGSHETLPNTEEKRYDFFKTQFDKEKIELEKEGIVVVNCGGDKSKLECFPKVKVYHGI